MPMSILIIMPKLIDFDKSKTKTSRCLNKFPAKKYHYGYLSLVLFICMVFWDVCAIKTSRKFIAMK